MLKYKHQIDYLGVIISDRGAVKSDVKSFIDKKRPNISIKFSNFCQVNRNASLFVKMQTLDLCVSTAITYACETWGSNINEAELCYRAGLKCALSIRENINNEIIYLESGRFPLACRIKKLQLKFWLFINKYIEDL